MRVSPHSGPRPFGARLVRNKEGGRHSLLECSLHIVPNTRFGAVQSTSTSLSFHANLFGIDTLVLLVWSNRALIVGPGGGAETAVLRSMSFPR